MMLLLLLLLLFFLFTSVPSENDLADKVGTGGVLELSLVAELLPEVVDVVEDRVRAQDLVGEIDVEHRAGLVLVDGRGETGPELHRVLGDLSRLARVKVVAADLLELHHTHDLQSERIENSIQYV